MFFKYIGSHAAALTYYPCKGLNLFTASLLYNHVLHAIIKFPQQFFKFPFLIVSIFPQPGTKVTSAYCMQQVRNTRLEAETRAVGRRRHYRRPVSRTAPFDNGKVSTWPPSAYYLCRHRFWPSKIILSKSYRNVARRAPHSCVTVSNARTAITKRDTLPFSYITSSLHLLRD